MAQDKKKAEGRGDAIEASKVKAKKVEFIWKDRIPKGMITVVAGKPDQGKGLFAAHVAAEVSKKGKVLYSAMEDDHGMMTRPRLEAAGANLDNVYLWRFRLPEQEKELAAHVRNEGIKLVVLDPFAAHLSGGVSRTSDSIREVTQPMSELAEETGVSFLIVEHALKRVASNAHPLNAIGGSGSGLPAASRMAFVFGVDPDDGDRRLLVNVKSNLRDKPKAIAFETDSEEFPIVGEVPSLIAQGETEFDPMRLLASTGEPGKRGPKPDKRTAAAEWLTQYLAASGKPTKAGDVLEDGKQHGLSSKTLRRAADDMGVVRQPPSGGRNCTWDLPADVKKALAGLGKKGGQS